MDCIICGNWFSSAINNGACPTCERAMKQLGLNMMPNRIKELAQAEKDGRLVVLPCKVGDIVYMPVGRYGITGFEEDKCDGFYINRDGILQIKAQCYSGNHGTYGVPGKTVFLTREEAEAALKKEETDYDQRRSD